MKGQRICLGKKKLTIKQNKTKKMAYKKGPATFMKGQTKNKAVGYMAQGSAFHLDPETTVDEFGTPIPKGFKADAPGVTGTVKELSSIQGVDTSASTRGKRSQLVKGGLSEGEDLATEGFFKAEKIRQASQPITTREGLSAQQKKAVMQSRSYSGKKSPKDVAKILGIKPTITTVKVDK